MLKTKRLLASLMTLVLAAVAGPAFAQSGRDAQINLVVSYPPGGLSDYFARLMAPKLSESLGMPVIVDNKPGANGAIGTAAVARAKPDGTTISLLPASVLTTNPWLMKDLGYDPQKDVTPLGISLIVPNVLVVNPSVPAKTLPELLALMKAQPGKINYASVGAGSSTHLNGEMLRRLAGVDIVHVAYKGAGPALQDVVAGNVQMMFDNLPAVLPLIQSGKLRAIAVTSAKASPALPGVPPVGQFLPGFEATPWFGFIGPMNMPADLVAKFNAAIVKAARSPDIVEALKVRGGETIAGTPEEMAKLVRSESDQMRQLIKDADITLN
ncbi:MAG: tripartite tricarboxylate transporter substrate binding protein [Alphaproteobacteria bacterium]